jgi:hypothetical protein
MYVIMNCFAIMRIYHIFQVHGEDDDVDILCCVAVKVIHFRFKGRWTSSHNYTSHIYIDVVTNVVPATIFDFKKKGAVYGRKMEKIASVKKGLNHFSKKILYIYIIYCFNELALAYMWSFITCLYTPWYYCHLLKLLRIYWRLVHIATVRKRVVMSQLVMYKSWNGKM